MNRRLGFILLMALIFTGCSGQEKGTEGYERTVRVLEVREETVQERLTFDGAVIFHDTVNLAFSQGGTISRIDVVEGDLVSEGELLAMLDPKSHEIQLETAQDEWVAAEQQVRQTQANVAYLEEQYDNMAALYEAGAVSRNELDQVRLSRDLARAALRAAEAMRSSASDYLTYLEASENRYRIVADGERKVARIHFEEGETVGAGIPVVTLAASGTHIGASLVEEDLRWIDSGDEFSLSEGGTAEIVKIDINPDPVTLEYAVVLFTSKDLPVGHNVTLDRVISETTGILLPFASVLGDSTGHYVYLEKDGYAERREVVIEKVFDERVMIRGIESGERVVIEGQTFVRSGDPLRVNMSN